MMFSIKTLLFTLPFLTFAQIILSPPDCTLECVDHSLNFTSCAQANGGLSDPSVVPCLCEDKGFLFETVNCVINSDKCQSDEDKQRSFTYAYGLCDSAGITLPGASPSDLPYALGVSTSISSTSAAWTTTVPTTSILTTVIEEAVTTNLTIVTSSACPVPSGNMTYIVVVNNNITQTTMPEPTVVCGNLTKTTKVIITRKSTSTVSKTTNTMSTTSIEGPSATDEGAAGKLGVQVGGMLGFVGALMWLI